MTRQQSDRQEPFPSSPRRPPLVGLYMTNESLRSWHYAGFAAPYAAAKFLDKAQEIQGAFKLKDDDMHFTTGWVISTRGNGKPSLQELLKYQPTKAEDEWEVPDELIRTYRILRNNTLSPSDVPAKSVYQDDIKPARTPAPKTPARRPQPGLISLSQLCTEQGVSPGAARRLLRSKNIEKPYEWSENDLARIVAIITGKQ